MTSVHQALPAWIVLYCDLQHVVRRCRLLICPRPPRPRNDALVLPQSSAETAESQTSTSEHGARASLVDVSTPTAHLQRHHTMAPKGGNAKKESGRAKKAENEVGILRGVRRELARPPRPLR